jgi:hypothetical protein
MSMKKTLSTVSPTTTADAKRKGSERSQIPAASNATPARSQTAE